MEIQMIVVIPTFMREDNQKCYNAMPPEIQSRVVLVTHSGRAELLKQNNPTAKVVDLGQTDGIADVRQKVIEKFHGTGATKVMIIDDSCTFKKRDENMKLVNMEVQDWNNRVLEDVKEIGRSYSCYGLNVAQLFEQGIRFDGMYQKDKEIKLYEDFYLILKLLTTGNKNAIIYKYAFNHPHGRKGGNSTVRTNELQKKCILSLVKEFPGLVELVKKENPSWKAGLNDEDEFRWEVKISWQEAYKRGLQGEVASLEDFFS